MLLSIGRWLRAVEASRAASRSSRRRNARFRVAGLESLEPRIVLVTASVAARMSSTDNIILLDSIAGFPTTPGFTIGVGDLANEANPALYERMFVTGFNLARNGLLVIRGADGTNATSHSFGDRVEDKFHRTQTLQWTGSGGDGKWSNGSNWFVQGSKQLDFNGIPPVFEDNLIFGASTTTTVKSTTNDLLDPKQSSGLLKVKSITFKQPGYTISGNGITLINGISNSATASGTPANLVVSLSTITLSNELGVNQFDVTGNVPLEIRSKLQGNGSLNIAAGTSKVLLKTAGTYTGGTTLKSGTLEITANSLGTGKLTLEKGTLSDGTLSALTLNNVLSLNGDVNFNLGGVLQLTKVAAVNTARKATVVAGTLELGGTLSGTGTLTLVAAPQPSTSKVGFVVNATNSLKLNVQNSGTASIPFTLLGVLNSPATVTLGPKIALFLGRRSTDAAGTGPGLSGNGTIICTQVTVSTGPALSNFTGPITLTNCTTTIAGATKSAALGVGPLTLSGGTLTVTGTSSAVTASNVLKLSGAVSFNLGGLLQFSKGATMTAASTLTVVAGTLELDGTLSGAGTLALVAAPQTTTTKVGFVVNANNSSKLSVQNSGKAMIPFTLLGVLNSTSTVTVGPNVGMFLGHRSSDAAGTGAGLSGSGSITCTQDNISTGPALSRFTGPITLTNCKTTIAGASTDATLGVGPLTLSGGTLTITGTSTVLRNPITLAGAAFQINFSAAGNLKLNGSVNATVACVLNVNTSTSNRSQVQFLGGVRGANLTVKQTSGKVSLNIQGGLSSHLFDHVASLNLAGPFSGILDVEPTATVTLASSTAGSATLSGSGTINVMGRLESQRSHPNLNATINAVAGEVDVVSGVSNVLGTGQIILDEGDLVCINPRSKSTVTLDNDVTLTGEVWLLDFNELTFTGDIDVMDDNSLRLNNGALKFTGVLSGSKTLVLNAEPKLGSSGTNIIISCNDQVDIQYGPETWSDPGAALAFQSGSQLDLNTGFIPPERTITLEKGTIDGKQKVPSFFNVKLGEKLAGKGELIFDNSYIIVQTSLTFQGDLTFNNCDVSVLGASKETLNSPLGTGTLKFSGNQNTVFIGGVQSFFDNPVDFQDSTTTIITFNPNAHVHFRGDVTVGDSPTKTATLRLGNASVTDAQIEFSKSLTGSSLILDKFDNGAGHGNVFVNIQCTKEQVEVLTVKLPFVNIGYTLNGTLIIDRGATVALNAPKRGNVTFKTFGLLKGDALIIVEGELSSAHNAEEFSGQILLNPNGKISVGGLTQDEGDLFLGTGELHVHGGTIAALGTKTVKLVNALTISGTLTIDGFSNLTFSKSLNVTPTTAPTSTIIVKQANLVFDGTNFQYGGTAKVHFIGTGATVKVKGVNGKLPTQIDDSKSLPLQIL